ncbi:hypothetical protein F442_09464 [Phytophthora nicotianae P10297]|nr:hypothetical protein F444_09625 [Phytophthora nicotianae P1976]ETP43894.1 hypothetical protein F442_09464 [Phytophthora nicotianae P10297]
MRIIKEVFADILFMNRFRGNFKKSKGRLTRAKSYVNDTAFWKNLKLCIKLVAPIVGSIAAFESDNCSLSLSLIYAVFEKLKRNYLYTIAV